MDPISVAKLWMVVKPIKRIKEARQRRKERRMAEKAIVTMPDGSTHERSEPAIPLRTSTKVGIVAGLTPLLAIVPFYDQINTYLLAACQSEQGPALVLGGAAITWVASVITARLTKSPAKPGAL